ncbi:MAG: AMP-binding protein [Dehalococcoidales bacterium]|nr:AMP-binding protein [Dehalococcoidales bacterium]
MNLKIMLQEVVMRYGEKTAVVLGNRKLSYVELDEASNKVANALINIGVRKGNRVAILLSNSPEFIVIYFGIIKIGAIAVPLDTKYKTGELISLFNDSHPKVLVAESPFLEPLIPLLSSFRYIKYVISLSSKYEDQFLSYQEIITAGVCRNIEIELYPEDIAQIIYTSGPTFRPKGVMLSHRSLVAEVIISGDGFQQTDEDVAVLFALPLHHVVGLIIVLLTSISRGSKVIMLSGLSISGLLNTIEREKSTLFIGVPFVFALMVHMAEEEEIKYNLSSLRLCSAGGAPVPVELMKRFKQFYGFDIIQFWGLTESVAHVTCQTINGTGKLGSVGKALKGWKVKIVGDDGKELPKNQPGEMIVNGPLMSGYYNNLQATAEILKDGWLYTGDIGKEDKSGELFILGRKKEMIIVKGQNIYPSDIEDVLHTHPKIAEAVVMGAPDEMRGEIVKAVIRLKNGEITTEHEIRRFCLKRMANYKVPKQIIFSDCPSKNIAGKIYEKDLAK